MRADLDHDVTTFATAQFGLISRAQARSLGVPRGIIGRRVAAGRWSEVRPLVYAIAGAPESYERDLLAAVLSDGRAVASHRAAARLHGLPGFSDAPIEIATVHRARKEEHLPGVTRHYTTLLPDHHRKTLDAIPTTTVGRTLFDLGAVVHPGRAARAVDNCLSRKWVTVPALWRVLDDLAIQGRNGTCALREILMERGDGYVAPASELERQFMKLLRGAGLPLPEREFDLGDADQWIGRVEFVYLDARVLIEIDSRVHHSERLDFESDRERDNRFAAEGYRVLRITYEMMTKQPLKVERVIRRALRTAA
jgi:Protein of unknown function (DUF559)